MGATSGVGKTFAMLETAKEKLSEKKEVVIGWLVSHGRKEIELVAEGIPVIEPMSIEYLENEYKALDLDRILKEKPDIVIIDELAHSNIPSLRNKKRYQDVEELLKHGIDVYTTLNIHQLESLNDIVTEITETHVQETVPDHFLDDAQIQLVDIDPDTLIQRLHDGKVFTSGLSQEVIRHIFRPGNINALREITLRYAAKQVDKELISYRNTHSIEETWRTGEKVLVYIDSYTYSIHLLRTAKNLADSLKGDLIVALRQPPSYILSEKLKAAISKANQIAEELGAEIMTVSSDKILDSLVQIIKRKNITQLVIGKYRNRFRWLSFFKEPFENSLINNLTSTRVHLIPFKKEESEKAFFHFKFINSIHLIPLLTHILLVIILTIICKIFVEDLGLINISTLFVIPLLLSSLWGYQNSIIVTVVSFLLYDFFFIAPHNTFSQGCGAARTPRGRARAELRADRRGRERCATGPRAPDGLLPRLRDRLHDEHAGAGVEARADDRRSVRVRQRRRPELRTGPPAACRPCPRHAQRPGLPRPAGQTGRAAAGTAGSARRARRAERHDAVARADRRRRPHGRHARQRCRVGRSPCSCSAQLSPTNSWRQSGPRWSALAREARNDSVREGAFLALMQIDGDAAPAWQLASASPRLRIDLLRGATMLGSGPALDTLRTLLLPSLRAASAGAANGAFGERTLPTGERALPAVAAPVTGRYVRLVRPGRAQVLSVTEVEVLSRGENVARKGTATQSSIVAGGATGGHALRGAIDGGVDMAASAGSDPLTGTHAFTSAEQDPLVGGRSRLGTAARSRQFWPAAQDTRFGAVHRRTRRQSHGGVRPRRAGVSRARQKPSHSVAT